MESENAEKEFLTRHLIKTATRLSQEHRSPWKKIPGFNVSVCEQETSNMSCFYTLSLAIILQGFKEVDVGDSQYSYGAGTMIVTSVEIPTSFRILRATPEQPFVSMSMKLDASLLSQIMSDVYSKEPYPPSEEPRAFCVAKTSSEILGCFDRLLHLSQQAEDINFILSLLLRELHYYALTDVQCTNLRDLCTAGQPNNRISKAVDWIKAHYKEPLRIQDLADMTYMAASSVHTHFKRVTSLTPLQYQKRLRLHEAKRLMLFESFSASSAAFEVGYESVQQFSREYKRLFGQPPRKNTNQQP